MQQNHPPDAGSLKLALYPEIEVRTPTIPVAKLAARQANAQKNPGPAIDAGQASIPRNPSNSGFTGENLKDSEAMKRDEPTFFGELIASAWKLRRAQHLE